MLKTILIVDDSKAMRALIQHTLKNAGYQVLEAGDGQEALLMLNNGLRPNLILTDLNMPRMDGFEFTGAVRGNAEFNSVPILFLTTEAAQEEKSRGKSLGANGWLVKPFNPEKLIQVVGTMSV